MKMASRSDFEELKASCNTKAKAYVSVVWVKEEITKDHIEKLNAVRNLPVKQKTPIRVLHRRSQLVRDKLIYALYVKPIN